MATIVREMRRGWRLFAYAAPGRRFTNQYRRAQRQRSFGIRLVRVMAGTVLAAGGVVMLFLPGPGWLFVFFGLALFAGESRPLASLLDRTEMWTRARAARLRRGWRAASPLLRAAAIVGVSFVLVGLGTAAAWAVLA